MRNANIQITNYKQIQSSKFQWPRFDGHRADRSGVTLIWLAFLLTVLLGMVGLAIDGGLLMAGHRQAQNAADAAATAAAYDMFLGRPDSMARDTATTFVKQHNGLANAEVIVNIPPSSGPYASNAQFAEVIVRDRISTYFAQMLPGIGSQRNVQARAVSGPEAVSAGAGVITLDPQARPGLAMGGGGTLKVHGMIIDDSEGGGVDENGVQVNNGNTGYAATGGNQPSINSGIHCSYMHVVGGVDDPANFHNIDPSDSTKILHCKQLPIPDPLLYLPTPTVALGVDPTSRGSVSVSGNSNVTLYPGIYQSISITGGTVRFVPGVYIIRPGKSSQTNVLKITGGNVVADGVMFYNTGNTYDPYTGLPDSGDWAARPPAPDNPTTGQVTFNGAIQFSPIDTSKYNYGSLYSGAQNVSSKFDGILFFQRRRNGQQMNIEGNSGQGKLSGTVYAKWANLQISGQGTYDAQFILGLMSVTGSGNVTINYTGKLQGKAPAVFLVE